MELLTAIWVAVGFVVVIFGLTVIIREYSTFNSKSDFILTLLLFVVLIIVGSLPLPVFFADGTLIQETELKVQFDTNKHVIHHQHPNSSTIHLITFESYFGQIYNNQLVVLQTREKRFLWFIVTQHRTIIKDVVEN